MSRPWTLALVQARPATGPDPIAALAAEIEELIEAQPGLQMIVHPEIHLHGAADLAADDNAYLAGVAEPLDGPRIAALAGLARRFGIWLVPGSVAERGADGRVYNTAVVFDPTGALLASYRKVFPYRPYETWACGTEFVVFDVPEVGRFGLSICFDSWFPESTRQLAWLGAEVVLNLVKTTGPDRAQEVVIAQANAIVNQVYFLSVKAAGPSGWGQSIHVDPDGQVLAYEDTREPAVSLLAIDLDRVSMIRKHGTAGVTRVWEQLRDDDDPIELPAYGGAMTPGRWNPARPPEEDLS